MIYVTVDCDFSEEQYRILLEEDYMIENCSKNINSSYSREEKQNDRFLNALLNDTN